MTLENFKKVLENIRTFDKTIDGLEALGFEVYNSDMCDSFWRTQELLFTEIYTKEGYDWISYYLYEIPMMGDDREVKDENGKVVEPQFDDNGNRIHAWNPDGSPIDLSCDEALWKYLEKEYNSKPETTVEQKKTPVDTDVQYVHNTKDNGDYYTYNVNTKAVVDENGEHKIDASVNGKKVDITVEEFNKLWESTLSDIKKSFTDNFFKF